MGKETKIEQLENEIKEKQAELDTLKHKPIILAKMDFTKLIKCCNEIIDELAETGYSKDSKQYVYEEAMSAIFGKDVWNWINKMAK